MDKPKKPLIFLEPTREDIPFDGSKVNETVLLFLKMIQKEKSKKFLILTCQRSMIKSVAEELKKLGYQVNIRGHI
jgi:hypothetical protein